MIEVSDRDLRRICGFSLVYDQRGVDRLELPWTGHHCCLKSMPQQVPSHGCVSHHEVKMPVAIEVGYSRRGPLEHLHISCQP